MPGHQLLRRVRLPRALLSLEAAGQSCIDPYVAAWASGEHLILSLTSEDESGDWVEGAEDSLSAVVGVRAELAAGDLRPLYLAWLAAYGTWERDEDAFGYDEEDGPTLTGGDCGLATARNSTRPPVQHRTPAAVSRSAAQDQCSRPVPCSGPDTPYPGI